MRVTFREACDIAGSRQALEAACGRKNVQNWASAAKKAERDSKDGKVVPCSSLADLLLARWKGKQPPQAEAPLREMLDLVRELYAVTRGRAPEWGAVKTHIITSIGAWPKAGERYRPIASGGPPGER